MRWPCPRSGRIKPAHASTVPRAQNNTTKLHSVGEVNCVLNHFSIQVVVTTNFRTQSRECCSEYCIDPRGKKSRRNDRRVRESLQASGTSSRLIGMQIPACCHFLIKEPDASILIPEVGSVFILVPYQLSSSS